MYKNEGKLAGLEPAKVFKHFEKICSIPHGSGNTDAISSYLEDYAREKGLDCIRDEAGNIIIFKEKSAGASSDKPVIIQGHMDMVCVSDENTSIDFENEPISLRVSDGFVSAEGTSLGGDDGIAVAMALALLEDDDIVHPPLEILITVDEEVGMLGAAALDTSPLKGNMLLNVDSEEEGYILVSCAGGATVTASLKTQPLITKADTRYLPISIEVCGLTGGHSGVEIDKGRANACMLLGRILKALDSLISSEGYSLYIANVSGGGKDNAIPSSAAADICVALKKDLSSQDEKALEKLIDQKVSELKSVFRNEYHVTEPSMDVKLTFKDTGDQEIKAMSEQTTKDVIKMLRLLPNGIMKMSMDIDSLVQTSLNLGILKTTETEVNASFSVRSSVASEKQELIDRICLLMELLGGSVSVSGQYPAWEYKKDSALRDICSRAFNSIYKKEPVWQAIHAGVECGIFASKIHDFDAVSFGPNIYDIHSPSERLQIESVERSYKFLKETLRLLAGN
ncbi:MAG: aminoacyl-histidine dipeptidase [Lachnospiraceae bacterium]|nr:aminoacyl-histidine dipeptidase [Lachnospiraceae bacterium]